MYSDTDFTYARLGYRPNIPSMQCPTPYRILVFNWNRADGDTIQRYRDNLENDASFQNLVESSFE